MNFLPFLIFNYFKVLFFIALIVILFINLYSLLNTYFIDLYSVAIKIKYIAEDMDLFYIDEFYPEPFDWDEDWNKLFRSFEKYLKEEIEPGSEEHRFIINNPGLFYGLLDGSWDSCYFGIQLPRTKELIEYMQENKSHHYYKFYK